jgi:signal transduction histidine kinase
LHDTLLQGLHALIFRLQAWESDLVIPPEQRAEIALATAQARALIIEGRDRIAMLRRIHIGPEDLVAAFRSVADAQPRGQTVEYDIAIVGEQRSLSADGFAHLLDIAKEAIINAFRHAKANRIGVTIEYQKSRLEVVVQDDGCGMPTEGAAAAHHFGLLGMKERALELDAELSWTGNGVRGTCVTLKVPAISIYPASTAVID